MELSKSFVLFLAGLCSTVSGCPVGFVPWHEGYCYKIEDQYVHWDDNAEACRQSGGDLASIHSSLENARILDALKASGQTTGFIGLRCSVLPTWIDGTPMDFIKYSYAEASCLVSSANWWDYGYYMAADGSWKKESFDYHHLGICRHRRRNGERCSDYDEVSNSEYCISIRSDPQSWSTAESNCQAEFAHLISIHSKAANDFIFKCIRNPEVVGVSGAFHIGMQSQSTAKGEDLSWTDGSDANYTNYDTGYPTDVLGHCTAMQTTPGGKWVTTQCDGSNLPYICGRPVNSAIQPDGCPSNPSFKNAGTIFSPSYPSSSGPLYCEYYLTAPLGMKVNLVVNDLNTNLCCDKLTLYDGLSSSTPLATLSGTTTQTSYTTTSNTLKMIYSSTDGTFVRGWKVTFKGV